MKTNFVEIATQEEKLFINVDHIDIISSFFDGINMRYQVLFHGGQVEITETSYNNLLKELGINNKMTLNE